MDNDERMNKLVEQSTEMANRALDLAEASLRLSAATNESQDTKHKPLVNIIIALICGATLVTSIATYGYFFSSYDYYELPAIETTNTNTNTNGGE